MSEEKQEDKFPITKSDRFFSEVASDVAISGPTPDGLLHISFFRDRLDLVHQTKTYVEPSMPEKGFRLEWQSGDTQLIRLFVSQMSLTETAYLSLYSAITDRLLKQGAGQVLKDVLEASGIKAALPDEAKVQDEGEGKGDGK